MEPTSCRRASLYPLSYWGMHLDYSISRSVRRTFEVRRTFIHTALAVGDG